MIFEPFEIQKLALPNRIARSATAERGADEKGFATDELISLYRRLAEGGSGLIFTGHAFVRLDGRTNINMTGIHRDETIPGLSRLAKAVHKASAAKIVLQVNHAGRATAEVLIGCRPVAPSPIPVRMSGENPRELSPDEIDELVELYVLAALRAQEAGFDGVQLHCAHGYLISQFLSPYTNKREDKWGGSSDNRRRFLLEIIAEIEARAPDFPLLVKINSEDMVPGGVELGNFVETCLEIEKRGVDVIEVSAGIPESANKIIRKGIKSPEKEAYFRKNARALKDGGLNIPVILVGGLRSFEICEEILEAGEADIVSLSRPLITEPDLPRRWASGDTTKSRCISCNGCLKLRDEFTHCVYWSEKKKSYDKLDRIRVINSEISK